eukprot:11416376-Ditylum_brightwellii.AAC.1
MYHGIDALHRSFSKRILQQGKPRSRSHASFTLQGRSTWQLIKRLFGIGFYQEVDQVLKVESRACFG